MSKQEKKEKRSLDGFEQFERLVDSWSRRDFLRGMGGVAAGAFGLGGVGLLEACGNTGSGTPTVKKGGHLVEGIISDIKTFNPVLISDTVSSIVGGLCYDPLLIQKANGDLAPGLAVEVPKVDADGLTYTFKLRDAKWTDGKPITADDVVMTYQFMYDPKYKEVNSPRRGDLETYLDSVTAKDAKTVVMKTKVPYAPFLVQHSGYGILPKSVFGSLAPKEVNTAPDNSGPTVTSGVMKFVKWDKGSQVVLARNDTYWAGPANLDQYILKVLPDSVTVTNQLKTGEIDLGSVDPSLWDSLATEEKLRRISFDVAIFTFFELNLDPSKLGGKLFGQKEVRQALMYALDREKIIKSIYFGIGSVADSVIPPTSWAYNPNVKQKYRYDKAKAEALLDAAGWKKGADGIREKDGLKFKFEMLTNAGNKQRESVLQVLQQSFGDIGISATPKTVQFTELVSNLQNKRTFDLLLVGFSWDVDPNGEQQVFSSKAIQPGGFGGGLFHNDQVDKLLEQAATTFDRNKRKELYFQYQDLMADLVPYPVILYNKGIWAASKRVIGLDQKDIGLGTYSQFGNRPWMRGISVSDGK